MKYGRSENMKYLHKFSSCWCQPCRMLANNLDKIDLESLGVTLVEHDIDLMDRQRLGELKIRGIPTLIVMDADDNELTRKTGALTTEEIKALLAVDTA